VKVPIGGLNRRWGLTHAASMPVQSGRAELRLDVNLFGHVAIDA
jgi:hypothetical protein